MIDGIIIANTNAGVDNVIDVPQQRRKGRLPQQVGQTIEIPASDTYRWGLSNCFSSI